MTEVTKTAEELLEDLAAELEIPDSRYEAAERSYRSLTEWLERPESSLRRFRSVIYPQGSFRLGTVTKPVDEDEHYELDVVCELAIEKGATTQAEVKKLLGVEIEAYAKSKGMAEPDESRRCWTLDYADGAQFHMDALPALPDGSRQRRSIQFRTSCRGTALVGAPAERTLVSTRLKAPGFPTMCIPRRFSLAA